MTAAWDYVVNVFIDPGALILVVWTLTALTAVLIAFLGALDNVAHGGWGSWAIKIGTRDGVLTAIPPCVAVALLTPSAKFLEGAIAGVAVGALSGLLGALVAVVLDNLFHLGGRMLNFHYRTQGGQVRLRGFRYGYARSFSGDWGRLGTLLDLINTLRSHTRPNFG